MSAPHVIVVGMGYVGLPLAWQAVSRGLRVTGFDVSDHVVSRLNRGLSHVDDLSHTAIAEMIDLGFVATNRAEAMDEADAIVICVPTPLDETGGPDLTAVRSATSTVRDHLREGVLVVLESTTYPGTTEDVVKPLLEESGLRAGIDFHLAYSPERIDPGNPTFGVANTPKVVGGVNPASTKIAVELYERFIDVVVPTSGTREAEMAKLLENTYRHVNIALVNEMSIFCHDLGIDLWEAIAAASTKPFGFQAFYPGPGVGGHCIPIDPNYLSYKVRTLGYPFRFVELAQEISARMPAYVANRAMLMLNDQGLAISSAHILLLGVTYKRDISDERESPAQPLARRLLDLGAALTYADPHVSSWTIDDEEIQRAIDPVETSKSSDLVILLQNHSGFDLDNIVDVGTAILDTRGCVDGPNVQRL